MKNTGIAVALVWPKYRGKQTGEWYDRPMQWLGFNTNFHYQVGHAALMLVDRKDGRCFYFDSGRFHAPYQYGRVRDAKTDFDLSIKNKAAIKADKILNIKELLMEVHVHDSFRGQGPLYAAYGKVDFEKVWSKAKEIQGWGAFLFGPFVSPGTNCCRFVRTSMKDGLINNFHKALYQFIWPLRPMPITLYHFLPNKIILKELKNKVAEDIPNPTFLYTKENVHDTLPAPPRPKQIPAKSQWLGGEVVGSWFYIKKVGNNYCISRYSYLGKLECVGLFNINEDNSFDINKEFSFAYLSHCAKVKIKQGDAIFEFVKIKERREMMNLIEKEEMENCIYT